MAFGHPYAGVSRQGRYQDERNLPEYRAIQFYYGFNEGKLGGASKDNIFFDSIDPPTYGVDILTNGGLNGVYVGGVAPGWSIDVGVTASETTDLVDVSPCQRLTNLNGFTQAFYQSGIPLTTGHIYYVQFGVRRVSGTGNLQVKADGLSATSFDVSQADLTPPPGVDYVVYHFYGIASTTSTQLEFTSNDPSLVIDLTVLQMQEVGGGNHVVMEHNLYSNNDRGDNYYDFDGSTDFAKIVEVRQSNLDMGNKWSTVAIIKADSDGLSASKWTASGSQRSWQAVRTTSNRRMQLFWSHNGSTASNYTSPSNTVPAYPWTDFLCLGASFDNGVVTFYKNGVAVS